LDGGLHLSFVIGLFTKFQLKIIIRPPSREKEQIMISFKRGEIKRRPTPPGEILQRIYLDENGYTQAEFATLLAKATKNKVKESTMKTRLNSVISGKRAMTAEFAI